MPDQGTVQGLLLDRGGQVINVKHEQFGAVGDGVANDAPAINAALELARTNAEYGQGAEVIVYIPAGIYRLNQPLDMNAGTFTVQGAGSYHTVLRGNTGDKGAVVEMVGSTFSKLSGVLIDDLRGSIPEAQHTPSSVGVLLARVDAPVDVNNYSGARYAAMSWHNNLEDVVIRLGDRPTANNGNGTCAYYNYACEVSSFHNCFFLADVGAVVTPANLFGVQFKTVKTVYWRAGAPEQMRMWAADASMTVVRSSGANTVLGIRGPAIVVGGGGDFAFDAYLAHQGHQFLPGNPELWPKYAIEIRSQTHTLWHRGSIEAYPGAVRVVGASVAGLRLESYMSFDSMYDAQGQERESIPVVLLDKLVVEYPAGSGNMVHQGSVLRDSRLEPTPNSDSVNVIGRLVDTVSDAGTVIQDNFFMLGNLKVRLRNNWGNSYLRGNLATSSLPMGSGQIQDAGGSINRGGNLVAATDGVEMDSYRGRVAAVAALPAASAQHRGVLLRVEGGTGVADALYICEKNAADAYAWRAL